MSGSLVVYEVFEGENDADYQKQEIVWAAAPSSEAHKAEWWPGIVSKDSVGNPSVEVSYIKPHPFPKKPRKLEKSRIQILEFQMKLLKRLTPALPVVKRKFESAMKKAKKLDKAFVSRYKKKEKRNQENPFSLSANGVGKKKTKKSKSPSKKQKPQESLPPDPPEIYPCLKTLCDMKIKDQKELVLCPGDRIWFKSAIYGNRYLKAVIKEIYPGPGRSINLDIFESPTLSTPIQKYELKDGKEGNRLPKEGRIMLRYWTLVPGRFKPASCPFNKMASNFVTAAKNATKDLKGPAKQFLNKLNYPADVLADVEEDNLDADLDFLDDRSNSEMATPMPKRKKNLKKKKSKLEGSSSNDDLSLSPLMKKELSLSPLNFRKKSDDLKKNSSIAESSGKKRKSRSRNLKKKHINSIKDSEASPLGRKIRSSSRKRKKDINNDLEEPLLNPAGKQKTYKRRRNTSSPLGKIPKKKKFSSNGQRKIDSIWKKKRRSSRKEVGLIDDDNDQMFEARPRRVGANVLDD